MRNVDRIPTFTKELERIWIEYFPDWRFGQLMSNFLGWVYSEKGTDPFFPEESKMLEFLREYAGDDSKN